MKRLTSLLLAALLIIALFGCAQQDAPATTQMEESTMPKNIMQKSDPTQDDEMNILMIGSSFCYYYVEELYGMLTAAGYKNVNVCNVYYSGCPLQSHWEWWKSGEANYDYYTTNSDGRNGIKNYTVIFPACKGVLGVLCAGLLGSFACIISNAAGLNLCDVQNRAVPVDKVNVYLRLFAHRRLRIWLRIGLGIGCRIFLTTSAKRDHEASKKCGYY